MCRERALKSAGERNTHGEVGAGTFGEPPARGNDTLRPVSRYFHRITRPEQLIQALPRAMVALTDSALCGPATISICQDVQSLAFDYPAYMFEKRVWRLRRQGPDANELKQAVKTLLSAKQPVIVAGGGVRYSLAESELHDKKTQTAELSTLEVLTTDEQSTLSNLTSASKVAIWRLWVYIVAFAIWSLE